MDTITKQVSNEEVNKSFYHFSFPITLSEKEKGEEHEDKKIISDVQLAKQGTFNYPGFFEDRTITFSDEVFDTMITNFNDNVWGSELSLGLPFDAEHLEYLGALGWFTKLYKKPCADGKNGLFATVEWTKLGAEMIREGRFKYTSISYYTKYKNPETLKEFNYVVCGAALTTRPFLTGMEPVTCSKFKEMTFSEKELIDEFIKLSRKEEQLMSKKIENPAVQEDKVEASTATPVESVEVKTEVVHEQYDFSKLKDEIKEMISLSVKEAVLGLSKESEKESVEVSEDKKESPVEETVEMSISDTISIDKIDFSMHPEFVAMSEKIKKIETENEVLMSKNIDAKAKEVSRTWFLSEDNDSMKFTQDQKDSVVTFLSNLMKIDKNILSVTKFHTESKSNLADEFVNIVNSNFRTKSISEEKLSIGHASENESSDVTNFTEEQIHSAKMDKIVNEYAKQNNLNYADAYKQCFASGKISDYVSM